MAWGTLTLADGTKVPSIAYGSGSLGKGQSTVEYVGQAIQTGFVHIDTAQMYRNEEEVGQAIKLSGLARSELYITTKYSGVGGKSIGESFGESLKKLGVSYVDLYLIHHPRYAQPTIPLAWKEMEKIKESGLAKNIGVSNFSVPDLNVLLESANIKPAANQIRFHPGVLTTQLSVHEFGSSHGILTEGYSPLAPLRQQPGGAVDKAATQIAQKLGTAAEDVLLAWAKAKGVLVITSSRKQSRLEGYLGAGDLELTAKDVADIDEAGKKEPI